MNILLIDNFDSFTFNLVDSFARLGATVTVLRNTVPAAEALAEAEQAGALIVLSPGPGSPDEAGCCLELIGLAEGRVPVFGVCLGHQAIVQQAGGAVPRASTPMHGKASRLTHDGEGMFAGLPREIEIGRYHSLGTPAPPARFSVHAWLDGMAMAISDVGARQWGVQFHPESVLTPMGDALLANVLRVATSRDGTTGHDRITPA